MKTPNKRKNICHLSINFDGSPKGRSRTGILLNTDISALSLWLDTTSRAANLKEQERKFGLVAIASPRMRSPSASVSLEMSASDRRASCMGDERSWLRDTSIAKP